MTEDEARRYLLSAISDWLEGKTSVTDFIDQYWKIRRKVLNEKPSVLTGQFGEVMSHVDVATDSYSDDPEDPMAIDEAALRAELIDYLSELEGAGFR